MRSYEKFLLTLLGIITLAAGFMFLYSNSILNTTVFASTHSHPDANIEEPYKLNYNSNGEILRWQTCDTVEVFYNFDALQDPALEEKMLDILEDSLQVIEEHTGLSTEIVGRTEQAVNWNWAHVGERKNGTYPGIAVVVLDPTDSDAINPTQDATALSNPATINGVRQIVTGAVLLNNQNLDRYSWESSTGMTVENLLLHELGHVVGLGHAKEGTLMYYMANENTAQGFTPSDIEGLNKVRTCVN